MGNVARNMQSRFRWLGLRHSFEGTVYSKSPPVSVISLDSMKAFPEYCNVHNNKCPLKRPLTRYLSYDLVSQAYVIYSCFVIRI